MRKAFRKNWPQKIAALILATAIWILIRATLESEGLWVEQNPRRAQEATSAEVEEEIRALRERLGELEAVLPELRKKERQDK